MNAPDFTLDVPASFAASAGSGNPGLEPRVCPERAGSGVSGRSFLITEHPAICGGRRAVMYSVEWQGKYGGFSTAKAAADFVVQQLGAEQACDSAATQQSGAGSQNDQAQRLAHET